MIDPNAQMTPHRETAVLFDISETVLGEPGFFTVRSGPEIGKQLQSNLPTSRGLRFHKDLQCWTLAPVQEDIGRLHEWDADAAAILALHQFHATLHRPDANPPQSGLAEEPTFRSPSDLPGVNPGGLVQSSGDKFIVKRVAPPPATWSMGQHADWSLPQNKGIPKERIVTSFETFRAGQGFFLRWELPGPRVTNPQEVLIAFYFAQYALAFNGNGHALLFERLPLRDPDGLPALRERHAFRYAEPSDICDKAHTLAIWPCRDVYGRRYLSFANAPLDAAGATLTLKQGGFAPKTVSESLYAVDSGLRGDDPETAPGELTLAAPIGLEMRRDLRIRFQISKLRWATEGVLVDLPDALPPGASGEVEADVIADVPTGTDLTIALKNADDGTPYTAGGQRLYAELTFTGNGDDTPVLHAYRLRKEPVHTRTTPGEFMGGGIVDVRLDAYTGDAQSQTGQVILEDLQNDLSRLRRRGRFACQVKTTFRTPEGGDKSVILHQGYVWRPNNTKKGKPNRPGNPEYPSPDWHRLELPLLGMWKRLTERVETTVNRIFAQDLAAGKDPRSGAYLPWKVTDVIRYLLQLAGFPLMQIDIPDLDYRLWPGKAGSPAEIHILPEVGYAEAIQNLARNYLGAYLYFEPNAGAEGRWMLIFGTRVEADPIFHFTPTNPNPMKPPHILAGYPSRTAPVFGQVQSQTIPPDFNLVFVACPVPLTGDRWEVKFCNWLHNPKSYNVEGYPQQADPDHPDYIGYPVPLVIYDPTLSGQAYGQLTAAKVTQDAVDWTVNRLYDFLCHGQDVKRFVAPLVFVQDDSLGLGKWRPLRFQDPVTYDGVRYLVKSVAIEYRHDSVQMANYELIRPIYDAE